MAAPKGNNFNPDGRPQKLINWEEVKFHMMAGDNQEEIAAGQGVSHDTLSRRFKEEFGEDYSDFACKLHRKGDLLIKTVQLQKALKGNTQMLMWLGKVRLGQKEPIVEKIYISPYDEDLESEHEKMLLKSEIAKLQEKIDNLTKTG